MRIASSSRGVLLLSSVSLGLVACSSNDASVANLGYEGTDGGVGGNGGADGSPGGGGGSDGGIFSDAPLSDAGLPPGAGLGQACNESSACRPGLACDDTGKCAAGHSLVQGSPCVTAVECQPGLYCDPTRQCSPAGTGAVGAGCLGDSSCMADLRCALVGLSAQCVAAGTGDVGGTCIWGADCLGGLACVEGKCGLGIPGLPAMIGGGLWPGVKCEEETGAPMAWFHVPRGTNDGDFYRLPFPNDIRIKNGHPDLTGHPTPGAALLGYDLVDRVLRAIEEDNEGFGSYPTVFFRFNSAEFDFHSLDGPAGQGQEQGGLWYLDATAAPAGQFLGWSWSAAWTPGKYICANWMGIRPPQGEPLISGHTYIVIVTAKAKTKTGQAVSATDDFRAMVAASPPGDAALTAAYAAYKPLRDLLAARAVDPATIINAAVFTVGHPETRAKNVASAANAVAAPTGINWFKCGSDAGAPPCPDATGTRACGAADPKFDELQAVLPIPVFQKGTAPYLNPPDGGDIAAASAPPAVARIEQVCASLTVPKGTMPANGWPLVIYAHGTGGDFRSHIREGVAASLASADAGGTTVPMAVLGIDQVQNGARRAGSTLSPNTLFYNFANPRAARDNALQGGADQLSLATITASIDVAAGASPTGAALKVDPSAILFWGHSQGATEGALSVPFSTRIKGVVFSGQGASFLDALLGKTKPENIAAAIPFALQDPDPGNPMQPNGGAVHPVLSLLQMFVDPADPLNLAAAMSSAPPEGVSGHHVFQVYGLKDSFSPPATEATYANAANLGLVAHDPSVTTPDPILGPDALAESPAPFGANGKAGAWTAAVREYAPAGADDGHFVAFNNANASGDVARFLAQTALGQVPKVGK